jgi:DNA-binding Lrp family transcriptional regulator
MEAKLSKAEREVLRLLVQDGRVSYTDMAKKIGITPQAVGKMIDRLEKSGVIKGYTTLLDYEKLGINVFAIVLFRFKSGGWTKLEESYIRKRVAGPHLISIYRLSEGEYTHIVVYGFRSIKELDNYFHVLQTEPGHISEPVKIYVLSDSSIFKDSPKDLLLKVLSEGKEYTLARPVPPPK